MTYYSITYTDIGPVVVSNTNKTNRVLILGTALDGPNDTPVQVTSPAQAVSIFGPLVFKNTYLNPNTSVADGVYSGNELVKAYYEVSAGGCQDIWLCRISGRTASGSLATTGGVGFIATADYAGLTYNQITLAVTSGASTGSLIITAPAQYGGTLTYTVNSTTTITQLINTVNSDKNNSALNLTLAANTNPFATALSVINAQTTTSVTLAGGTYGTCVAGDLDNAQNKFGIYNSLTADNGTFDSIMDFDTDFVLLAGIYVDDEAVSGDPTKSFGSILATQIYNMSAQNPTHGVIGTRPLGFNNFQSAAVANWITSNWESTSAGYVSASQHWIKLGYFRANGFVAPSSNTNSFVDYSSLISVVAQDVRLSHPDLGGYTGNLAAIYVGQAASTPSQVAMTRQLMQSTLGLAWNVREKQLSRLVAGIGANTVLGIKGSGALVMFRTDPATHSPQCVSDVTFAFDRTKAFADLQPQRIVQEAIAKVKNVLNPYLGQPFNVQNEMAMNSQVNSVLDDMVSAGKLHNAGVGQSYSFSISATELQIANNELVVSLTLWPALQIKQITINTTVRR